MRKSDYAIVKDGNHHCPLCDGVIAKATKNTSGITYCCDISIKYGWSLDPILDHKAAEKKLIELNQSHAHPPVEDLCCWILSDGRFYHETFMNHINTAYDLAQAGVIPEAMDDERYIEKCWVKCTRSMYRGNVTIKMMGKPTAKQLNSIIKLAEVHKEEFFSETASKSVSMLFEVAEDRRTNTRKWEKLFTLYIDRESGKIKLEGEMI